MPRESKRRSEKVGTAIEPRNSPSREAFVAICLALVSTSPLWAANWLAEREQTIEKMSPAEKQDLNDEYKKFLALAPEQQEQLRTLHRQLDDEGSQGDRLRAVMHRYYDWLKTLRPDERADLRSLSTTDRLAKIKTLKQRQEAFAAKLPAGSHLTPQDVQVLSDWVKQYAAAHEAELSKDLPPRHADFPGGEKGPRERPHQFTVWRPWLGAKLPSVSQDEIDELMHQLSPEPRKAIEAKLTLSDKSELIHGWLQAIWRQRAGGGGGFGRHGRGAGPKELARFVEHDLTKEDQDKLSHITDKDEQHRELQRLYNQFQRHRSVEPGSGSDQHPTKPAPKALEPAPTKDSELSPSKPLAKKEPTTPPGVPKS